MSEAESMTNEAMAEQMATVLMGPHGLKGGKVEWDEDAMHLVFGKYRTSIKKEAINAERIKMALQVSARQLAQAHLDQMLGKEEAEA